MEHEKLDVYPEIRAVSGARRINKDKHKIETYRLDP